MRSNGNIDIDTDEQINITGSAKVYVQAADITLDAPTVTCTNNLLVNGNIVTEGTVAATGNISSQGTIIDGSGVGLGDHIHSDVSSGSDQSGPPVV